MPKFKKGDKVRQIMPAPVTGKVDYFTVDQETGSVQIRITRKDADGNKHRTYFMEHELELDPDVAASVQE